MSLALSLTLDAAQCTTFDTPVLRLQLRNQGTEPIAVPDPEADGGACSILVSTADGRPLRRLDSLTAQSLISSARIDAHQDFITLAGRSALDWTIDLARQSWPLPAGHLTLTASLHWKGLPTPILAPPTPIEVTPVALTHLLNVRDNPILDRLDILPIAKGRAWLRQHNPGVPLACWFNEILPPISSPDSLFLPTAGSYQAESFEPSGARWIVWQNANEIRAAFLQAGHPTGLALRAALPDRRILLRQGYYTLDNRLFLFLWSARQVVECCEMVAGSLVPVAAWPIPTRQPNHLIVRAFEDQIHILGSNGGLTHWTVNLRGQILAKTLVHPTRLPLYAASYQPEYGRCTALFASPSGEDKNVELFAYDPRRYEAPQSLRLLLPFRHRATELSMDADRNGRFHLLCSTADRKLYYLCDHRAPALIAENETRFFPHISSPGKVYLGCFETAAGFRYRQYSRKPHTPRLRECNNL